MGRGQAWVPVFVGTWRVPARTGRLETPCPSPGMTSRGEEAVTLTGWNHGSLPEDRESWDTLKCALSPMEQGEAEAWLWTHSLPEEDGGTSSRG